jgi:EmrB/QacA subfamily drug resistance transporter
VTRGADQVEPVADISEIRRWAILAVLAAVAFMAQLDYFIANVALAGIGKAFSGASLTSLSWVLNAYAIVLAAALVPAGRLADLWGRKLLLLLGVGVFTASSALCAAAPSLGVLIAGRALQGLGAAMIVPTSLGLLYPSFPKRQHTLVVGIWAAAAATAASAGPPVGGLLVGISWRLIFLINLPIGIATIAVGIVLLPGVREPRGSRLPDPLSVVSLLMAVGLLVLATVQAPEWGWDDPRTLVLFALAAAAAATTVRQTLHASSPVIEKRLFESVPFTAATIALLLFYCGFAVFLLGSALFMQEVWHFSALETGLGILPAPVIAVLLSICAGPIQHRFGRTLPAVLGTTAMALAATWWLLNVGEQSAYATELLPGLIIMGVSGGLSQAPLFAAAATLPADRATTGSAVLNMSRQIGSAVGVAVLIALTAEAGDPVAGFDAAWAVQIGVGLTAAAVLLLSRSSLARS